MHLFSCGTLMNTCKSHVSIPSSDPPAKVHNSAANSGNSGRDHNSSVVTNNKKNGKNSLGRELKIKYAAGDGISGILYKWVNFGKGWKPRWFVLQDGVLSYYKIHGPDKIVVNKESVKGSRVIGDESMKWILRQHINHNHSYHRNGSNASWKRGKAIGEIHLKVSFIRESQSDDRKFSIFTGTKWLHLRVETWEDRMTWMEAFHAVKDMLPKMPNSEVMAPIENLAVSTDKLRQVLMKEGLHGDAIQDIEHIMKDEFASLQNQLILLKQKHWLLNETLRELEVQVKTTRTSLQSSSIRSSVSSTRAH